MQNLIYFLSRYGNILLFLLLELICLQIIIRFNPHQRKVFLNSSNRITGWLNTKYTNTTEYLSLQDQIERMHIENAALKEDLINSRFTEITFSEVDSVIDTIHHLRYELLPAKVVNNSIRQMDNYLTLDKGKRNGVYPDMGVIEDNGLVGIVMGANEHYSLVISLLNRNITLSSQLRGKDFFGPLSWDGMDIGRMTLSDIPKHADVEVGDTVETSGFSSLFPQGLYIGMVDQVDLRQGDNFFMIKVKLSNDMSKVRYVNIVRNLLKEERSSLEASVEDE